MAMRVGTLSFARKGDDFLITPRERLRIIRAAASQHAPRVLLTAGHALHSRKHLERLAHRIAEDGGTTTIVTEVHHDGKPGCRRLDGHALYVIDRCGTWNRMGRQVFARRDQTVGAEAWRVRLFVSRLPRRLVEIEGRKVFVMGCGEINAVIGRLEPRFIDPVIAEAVLGAELVLNPTHDRMGRAAMLHAKRAFLSQAHAGGRQRAYASCSNWNLAPSSGIPQRPSATLHSCFVAGRSIDPEFEVGGEEWGFLYRAYQVP